MNDSTLYKYWGGWLSSVRERTGIPASYFVGGGGLGPKALACEAFVFRRVSLVVCNVQSSVCCNSMFPKVANDNLTPLIKNSKIINRP